MTTDRQDELARRRECESRRQMVEKAARVLADYGAQNYGDPDLQPEDFFPEARLVLDAILPQVTTVAELEALPVGTVVAPEVKPGRTARDLDGKWYGTDLDEIAVRICYRGGFPPDRRLDARK